MKAKHNRSAICLGAQGSSGAFPRAWPSSKHGLKLGHDHVMDDFQAHFINAGWKPPAAALKCRLGYDRSDGCPPWRAAGHDLSSQRSSFLRMRSTASARRYAFRSSLLMRSSSSPACMPTTGESGRSEGSLNAAPSKCKSSDSHNATTLAQRSKRCSKLRPHGPLSPRGPRHVSHDDELDESTCGDTAAYHRAWGTYPDLGQNARFWILRTAKHERDAVTPWAGAHSRRRR